MNVEIVAIGTELLLGQSVDTNSAWLAKKTSSQTPFSVGFKSGTS
jgi:molybdopterin-biosynthesis enzyme MoeA-like protein